MTKYLTKLIFFFFLLLPEFLSAQGREFWFAAPEVTSRHGDRPIVLRISSFDNPAEITISQPANPSFTVIKQLITRNTVLSINLTSQIESIETKPSDKILNTGLLIQSTNDINAYYEVEGAPPGNPFSKDNAEIFVLKGNNALGILFFVPMQSEHDNQTVGNLDAWSSFDIVATENNTHITITPTKNLVGHNKGETFSIILNKGQTFSCRTLSIIAKERPTGSKIESDKPIAITYKDDSILKDGRYWDLIGDQILPVKELGAEYVVIKNSNVLPRGIGISSDYIFVTAVKNNSKVFFNKDSVLLNLGESFNYRMADKDSAMFIRSSEPIYALHLSGFYNELACANLLPLKCTGSKKILFIRTNNEDFAINILVRSGGESNFQINGSSNEITSSSFKEVPGTNGIWKFARFINKDFLKFKDVTYTLSNSTHSFHLSVLNGGFSSSFKYGYYSGFANLNLGPDKSFCPGESTVLDAGLNKDSYDWTYNGLPFGTSQTVIIKDTGTYYATTTKDDCSFTDTIHVSQYPNNTQPILGKDTASCAKNQISIMPESKFRAYLWQDNSSTSFYLPKQTGKYTLQVTDSNGCLRKDSLFFKSYSHPQPEITWDNNTERFCNDSLFTFGLNSIYKNVLWYNGETSHSITTSRNEDDVYSVQVKNDQNCESSALITIDCEPYISIPNIFTPNGDGVNETFRIRNLKSGSWNFQVLNRWGTSIYSTDSYKNDWKAENIPDGVYFYTLKNTEKHKDLKGWVQILR